MKLNHGIRALSRGFVGMGLAAMAVSVLAPKSASLAPRSTLLAQAWPPAQNSVPIFVPSPSQPAPLQPNVTTPSTTPRSSFTAKEIQYFMEVAMGSEYGDGSPRIRKWSGDVRIQSMGKPTAEDLRTLQSVVSEINALTNGQIRLQLVTSNPNLTLRFVPESQFARYEPAYVPVNYGFFATSWDTSNRIYRANVLITTTGVTQKERSHLIREELTQSLGLMRDSYRYANSMFYQPWTDVTQYAEIDKALIQMLYSAQIQPGMTPAQVLNAFKSPQSAQRAPLRFPN